MIMMKLFLCCGRGGLEKQHFREKGEIFEVDFFGFGSLLLLLVLLKKDAFLELEGNFFGEERERDGGVK